MPAKQNDFEGFGDGGIRGVRHGDRCRDNGPGERGKPARAQYQ